MKNILIIGGSSGISAALANQLHEQRYQVFTACRRATNYQHQNFDILSSTPLDIPENLNGLVYCPGSINFKPLHRISMNEILDEFKLNALGAASVIQQALPALKKSEHASIVLFSTVAVQTGLPCHASIAMAKGAIEGLTRTLAAELSPTIRVNAIAPSLTKTPLVESLTNTDQKIQASENRHTLQRIGDPREIASLATWLLSDASRFITGQIIQADGGMSSTRTF